jgi:hypothetical protein
VVACVSNVKPKPAGVLVAVEVVDAEETVAEPDGVPVGDDEMEVGSEAAEDSEVDVESEVEGRAEPVGIGMVPMVLGTPIPPEEVDAESEVEGRAEPLGIGMVPIVLGTPIPPEEVVAVPDAAVAAAQSVADTVTVDTTVTVTMLSVPMTTVGVTIPFVAEEDVVAEVIPTLDVILEMELETTGVGLRVGSDDVVAIVEVDENDKI